MAPVTSRRRFRLALFSTAVLAALWIFSRFPSLVESLYSQKLFPLLSLPLSALSGILPFSLAEFLILLLFVWLLYSGLRLAGRVLRGKQGIPSAAAEAGLGLVTLCVLILVPAYLLWGLNYARPALDVRLGWDHFEQLSATDPDRELADLCLQLVELTNLEYAGAVGMDDMGTPSGIASQAPGMEIDRGFERAARQTGLGENVGASYGRAKPVFFSVLMSRVGLAGFYFPWTAEANYNRLMPGCELPHAIAHEKAHQRGMASEDEANLAGFLACLWSSDAYTRYSGYLFAQRQMLSELAQRDRELAGELVQKRLPGVQRDLEAARSYWRLYEGRAAAISASVNDSYLKFHGVQGGIESYSRSSRLILLFARSREGDLSVQRPSQP